MGAVELLERVRRLDALINARLAERTRLRAMATDIGAKPLDGMPYSNTVTGSQKLQDAVVKLIELEHEIDGYVDEYIKCREDVVNMLLGLPTREFEVLHRYYIQGLTWEQVAEAMDYSTTQVWRLKKSGLAMLDEGMGRSKVGI